MFNLQLLTQILGGKIKLAYLLLLIQGSVPQHKLKYHRNEEQLTPSWMKHSFFLFNTGKARLRSRLGCRDDGIITIWRSCHFSCVIFRTHFGHCKMVPNLSHKLSNIAVSLRNNTHWYLRHNNLQTFYSPNFFYNFKI